MNIPQLLEQHRAFFETEKTRDVNYVKEQLKLLKSEIENNEDGICEALNKDFGKSKFEAIMTEILVVVSELNLAIKNVSKWSKPKNVLPSLLNFPSSDYIYSEPYGSVLVIGPWNYPFQLTIAPLVAAIAAGNTAVIKPSELTPHTSQIVQEIVTKVFDPSHVSVVQGGIPETTNLLAQRWDYIFFTGSVAVGKIVAKAAAQFLTPVTLELGGKSPCIIDETVNLRLISRRIVWGKLVNAGQTCIAPDYIIVKKEIKAAFIEAYIKAVKHAYGPNPKESQDYPRIINNRNFNRLKAMLANVNITFGGDMDEDDCYISPTVIDEPSLDSAVMKDEIFGPILPVLTYENEDDIHSIISSYDKPLSFYVFSNKKKFANRLITKYSFGGGVINDTVIHFANHRLPFGGVGESGIGAYHGRMGFDTFSHKKGVVKRGNWSDPPVRYAPYKGKMNIMKNMFKWFG